MDDNLLLKYIQGQAEPEEKNDILNRIESDAGNKEYYRKMRELWDLSLITGIDATTKNEAAYQQVSNRIQSEKRQISIVQPTLLKLLWNIGKIAAIVFITFFVSYYFFVKQDKSVGFSSIETPIGHRTKLTLPDGSVVWLNSGTTLTYPEQFSSKNRTVILDGEARFDVKHIQNKPFIVKTSDYSVTVLGTQFNVFAYNKSAIFETSLLEGSILLKENNNQNYQLKMKPGQQAAFNKATAEKKIYDNVDVNNSTSWQYGLYSFEKVEFGRMLEKLSYYYNKKIIINNPEIAKYECTGKFQDNESLEHILNVIKISKPFNYKVTGENIIIY